MYLLNGARLKSLLKGISWRIIGTIDTFIIALFITGDSIKAISIGGVEVFTKILLYYFHERVWDKKVFWKKTKKAFSFVENKNNIHPSNEWLVNRENRELLLRQKGRVIWMTGLSGAGKTTIARHLEKKLFEDGFITKVLDGDILRSGINADLGFSEKDRMENIRRTAEIAKEFSQLGIITIVSVITPKEVFRAQAKETIGSEDFHLIYVKASLDICEKRDIKGLYAKARQGKIKDFTGVSAANSYECPINYDLLLQTDNETIEESVQQLYEYMINIIKRNKAFVNFKVTG